MFGANKPLITKTTPMAAAACFLFVQLELNLFKVEGIMNSSNCRSIAGKSGPHFGPILDFHEMTAFHQSPH